MSSSEVLALDAGQTEIKVRVRTGTVHRDLSFPGIHTDRPLEPQLASAAHAAAETTGAQPAALVAGISGLTDTSAKPGAVLALVPWARTVGLAHDSVTSYLGARGSDQGAVVAAGTGVVTLAVGPKQVARVDGWGYIMGDAGSGYWIGREALDAVMRQFDGRGGATAITDAVTARWPSLADAYVDLQASPDRVRVVASFAAVTAALADTDAIAADISDRAAAELAASALTALRRVTADGEKPSAVCAIGGVFRSNRLKASFVSAVQQAGSEVIPPVGAGIDGVMLLADLPATHPLAAQVYRAMRPAST